MRPPGEAQEAQPGSRETSLDSRRKSRVQALIHNADRLERAALAAARARQIALQLMAKLDATLSEQRIAVRDDRPFAKSPPAACRMTGQHKKWRGTG